MGGRGSLVVILMGGIALVVGGTPRAVADEGPAAKGAAPALEVGRFQIAAMPGHVYVLDTATGRVWEQFDPDKSKSSDDFLKTKLDVQPQSRATSTSDEVAVSQAELRRLRGQVRAIKRRLAGRERSRAAASPDPTYQGKPLSDWLRMLRDGDPEFRRKAAQSIAAFGPRARAAIPALISATALEYSAAVPAWMSATALPYPARPGAAKPEVFVGALASVDPNRAHVRAQLHATEYAARRDAALVFLAVRLLPDSGDVRKEVVPEDREVIPMLIEILADRRRAPHRTNFAYTVLAMESLVGFGRDSAPAVPVLCELLTDREPTLREVVARLLGIIGPPAAAAVPSLQRVLKDDEPTVRAGAAAGLGGIGPKARAAVPLLLGGLRDRNAEVRAASASALGSVGAEEAIPALKDALKDRALDVRREAVNALGRLKDAGDRVVPILVQALGDADAQVQDAAGTALGGLGTRAESAVPDLIRRAENPQDPSAVAAFEALRQIAPAKAEKIAAPPRRERPPVLP